MSSVGYFENLLAQSVSSPEKARETLRLLDRLDAEAHLMDFARLMWPVLEPGREMRSGWALEAICEHLEAVTRGEILRLLINVPPGMMKSLLTNVFWPAWEWGPRNLPFTRYVNASYSESLSVRDNRKARNLMSSELYQEHWGDRFKFSGDQNAKIKFENDKTGFKLATSVGGVGTGERGDRFVVDDPHNVKEGESDAKREEAVRWFSETVTTRVNDPEKSAVVVIMQRVHSKDVSGHILKQELGYVQLMLPMEFEPERRCVTVLGFEDPRTQPGELVFPERFPPGVVERDKKAMGAYAVAGQFQQRPAAREGAMFKRHWFIRAPSVPQTGRRIRAWDLGATPDTDATGDPDWTVGVLLREVKEAGFVRYYVEDVVRLRGSAAEVERAIVRTAQGDGPGTEIRIPQDPGQAGKAQVSYLAGALRGFVVRPVRPSSDKETRAKPFAAQAEAGNIYVLEAGWTEDYLDELCLFPAGSHDDQVDATSDAFNELTTATIVTVGKFRS
jgi:predicted phage terminase large subunit-like protein